MAGRGTVLGYRIGARLVAFGTLLTGLAPGDRTRERLGLAEDLPLAMMQGAVVDPACRGRQLHRRLLRRRLALLQPPNRWHLYASAAPGNTASWRNMLAEGYEVVLLSTMYGRLLRYTLYRPAVPRSGSPPEGRLIWCDPRDSEAQQALLTAGARGLAFRARAGQPEIGYLEAS
ncbi:MAG: hypothetical protein Kilf2KO_02630 [Rhodospirillales bacterium]